MVTAVLEDTGFMAVRWIEPSESGYYQPIVMARLESPTGLSLPMAGAGIIG